MVYFATKAVYACVCYAAFSYTVANACVNFNASIVSLDICGDIANKNLSYEAKAAGFSVAKGQFLPYYINERGIREDDNAHIHFSIPVSAFLPTAMKFRVRVLASDRDDKSPIFEKRGDTIAEWCIWNPAKYPDCMVSTSGDLSHRCWDSCTDWNKIGRF